MEILTEQITEIKYYNDFEEILKLLYTAYNRNVFDKLYNESEQQLKGTENEHNLNKLHEIFYNKKNDYYNSLGLNNLKLKDNEQDYNYLSELMENLTDNIKKYDYLLELYGFNYYGYYLPYFMENNFKFDIKSEYHIIIDYENKKIFNLEEDNETEIITELIKLNDLINNDSLKFEYMKQQNENNNIIDYNNKFVMQDYNLSFENCRKYNKTDNYIIIDYNNKWKSFNELDNITETELLNEIIQDNIDIINCIIDNN